jgi:GH24 family phage-related lysozyme (muramidase)
MGDFDSLVSFAQKYGQSVVQAAGIAPGFQATKASVVNSFVAWSKPLEGYTNFPYTDAHGLVTTGMGNLIDSLASGQTMGGTCGSGTSTPCGQATPTGTARALPWAPNNLDADWAAIKAAWPGTQSLACKGLTSSRLSDEAIQDLIASKMKENEAYILQGLPNFAQAPADAQLAVYSMSWAMGPAFTKTWTQFRNAFNAGDYATAAAQSHMKGVGIDMRNLANKLLLTNASKPGIDPEHLYYLEGLVEGVASTLPGIGPIVAGAEALLHNSPTSLLSRFTALPMWERGLIVGGVVLIAGGLAYAFVSLMESPPAPSRATPPATPRAAPATNPRRRRQRG